MLRTFLPGGLDFPVLKELEVIGAGRREYAICPVCGSSDRERLVHLYATRKLRIGQSPLRLLHVAPEANLSRKLQQMSRLEYVTADISGQNVMVQMDLTTIQYPEDHFSGIICNHVLEHIIDDRQAMRELLRVLRPGGWAILQVPMSKRLPETREDPAVVTEADRERVFGQNDHVRIYASDYTERLQSVGFDVETFRWWTAGEEFASESNRYGLLRDEDLFVAWKPAQ